MKRLYLLSVRLVYGKFGFGLVVCLSFSYDQTHGTLGALVSND